MGGKVCPIYAAAYRETNREKLRASARLYRRTNLPKRLWQAARIRAKEKGLEFDLEIEDIIVPDVCPVLSIPLKVGDGLANWFSPSIDRIDNSRGYTKDNIMVISRRANSIKSDSTIEEMEKILEYMKNGKKA